MSQVSACHRRAALGALLALGAAPIARRARAQAAVQPPSASAAAEAFDFVALGDMPYGPDLIAGPAYRRLIEQINQLRVPFAIHVGDFKDGKAACSDDEFLLQWQHFQRFASALVYTPGDNDWLDCQRRGADPLERLQALRERFFVGTQSLGQRPLALQRQAELMPEHGRYRENQRWWHQGTLFVTVHTVGPTNGSDDPNPAVRDEARAREAANSAWLRAAFDQARSGNASALVVATQAETLVYPDADAPRRGEVHPAFGSIAHILLPLADTATHPVLLIHGDHHRYLQDQPFRNAAGRPIANLWRLQVFGQPRIHAVRVRVQPAVAREPFAYSPVWNPMSSDPQVRPNAAAAGLAVSTRV